MRNNVLFNFRKIVVVVCNKMNFKYVQIRRVCAIIALLLRYCELESLCFMKNQLYTNVAKDNRWLGCNIWMICLKLNWFFYGLSRMLQFAQFVWTLRSSVWDFFNNFLLTEEMIPHHRHKFSLHQIVTKKPRLIFESHWKP